MLGLALTVCDGADGILPAAIQTDEFEGSMLSDITVEEHPRPLTSCTVLTPSECGMPKTPPPVVCLLCLVKKH